MMSFQSRLGSIDGIGVPEEERKGVGEMSQLVKCLGPGPQQPQEKPGLVVCSCDPSAGVVGDNRDKMIPEAC